LNVRFAYADPPYPGQAKRWYRDHPDYAGEVDHAELIARLKRNYPDGWALSTNAISLRQVLMLCPADIRVAIWHQNNSGPGFMGRWHYCWEPVLVHGGRKDGARVCNLLTAPIPMGFVEKIPGSPAGQKPAAFSRWVFALLGARPEDTLDDLFPGSGAVGREWMAYAMQPMLLEMAVSPDDEVA
jgi:hypothetical protein